MAKQVDYPADTVGADGTVYQTVGENIRHLWKKCKIITIKAVYDDSKFTSVECPVKTAASGHTINIYSKEVSLLSVSVDKNPVPFNSFYLNIGIDHVGLGILIAETNPNTFIFKVIVSE